MRAAPWIFTDVEVAKKLPQIAKRQLADKNAVGMWPECGVGLYGGGPSLRRSIKIYAVFRVFRAFLENYALPLTSGVDRQNGWTYIAATGRGAAVSRRAVVPLKPFTVTR